MLIGLIGMPLAGKAATLQVLAKRLGRKLETFEIEAPASAPWPKLAARGLRLDVQDGLTLECFSGGVPPNAERVALDRFDGVVLLLDVQPAAQARNREFFVRNRDAILAKPRIYQLTKLDLGDAGRVRAEDFGRSGELVVQTNLKTGDGYDALFAAITNLAATRLRPSS